MYADKQESSSNGSSRSRNDTGRWKHDKFEMHDRQSPIRSYGSDNGDQMESEDCWPFDAKQNRIEGTAVVMLSNLAMSVTQEDLDELLAPFDPVSVSLNHDSTGKSVGSATAKMPNSKAEKFNKDYGKVIFDGKELVINVTAGVAASQGGRSIQSRITRIGRQNGESNGIRRQTSPLGSHFKHRSKHSTSRRENHRGNDRRRNNDSHSHSKNNDKHRNGGGRDDRSGTQRKPKKTTEELDRELEEYMKA